MSLRKKINQNCRGCINYPYAAGNWRKQTTLCTVTNCSFREVSPVTKPKKLSPRRTRLSNAKIAQHDQKIKNLEYKQFMEALYV